MKIDDMGNYCSVPADRSGQSGNGVECKSDAALVKSPTGLLSGLHDLKDHPQDSIGPTYKRRASVRSSKASDDERIATARPSRVFSQATVNGSPYQVDENTPVAIQQFLSQSLSNHRYNSEDHLAARAQNYLAYIDAERKLTRRANSSLQNVQSAASLQSAWLCHLERRAWLEEPALEGRDRLQLGDEVAGTTQAAPSSPYAQPRPWLPSRVVASAFSMMVKGEHGPFTLEQTMTGFETIQEGVVLACDLLKIPERVRIHSESRHEAKRNGTHIAVTPSGTDLSKDPGTRLRDAFGIPVMNGTSGSSSDVALSALYSAERAKSDWYSPGLNPDAAKAAMVELAMQAFRTEGMSPTTTVARRVNELRSGLGLPTKDVEAHQVFTHSYAEIHAGINLTLDKISPTDPRAVAMALKRVTREAKEHLDAAST